MDWILVLVSEILMAVIFWLIGYRFGERDGTRTARAEFDKIVNEMREDEKKLEEEYRDLDRRIEGIRSVNFGKERADGQ